VSQSCTTGAIGSSLRWSDGCALLNRVGLRGENPVCSDAREAEQAQQAFFVIGRAFGSGLHFGNLDTFDQDEIGI